MRVRQSCKLCPDSLYVSGQPLRHTYCVSAKQASPAGLAHWVEQEGGRVQGIAILPAGDSKGYGLWSDRVSLHTDFADALSIDS